LDNLTKVGWISVDSCATIVSTVIVVNIENRISTLQMQLEEFKDQKLTMISVVSTYEEQLTQRRIELLKLILQQ